MPRGPNVLILDIELAPLQVDAWDIWQQNIGINQIRRDRFILSYAAKWWGRKEIFYQDQSKRRNIANDKELCRSLWKLIDQADIIVGHNIKKFDEKIIYSRFLTHSLPRPSKCRVIDTLLLAKRHFSFISNSLEYLTSRLCVKHKKKKSRKFIGHELWTEVLHGNPKAWKEFRAYNVGDILSTEELWEKLEPYDNSINFNVYTANPDSRNCKCGGLFVGNGTSARGQGVYQRFKCNGCGAPATGKENLVKKEFRKGILK